MKKNTIGKNTVDLENLTGTRRERMESRTIVGWYFIGNMIMNIGLVFLINHNRESFIMLLFSPIILVLMILLLMEMFKEDKKKNGKNRG